MFHISRFNLQPAVVVSIMPQLCYKIRLPFLALPLYHDTCRLSFIGEHSVTAIVTEVVMYSIYRSDSSLRLFPQLRELRYGFIVFLISPSCT
jgi:hypothetical protein